MYRLMSVYMYIRISVHYPYFSFPTICDTVAIAGLPVREMFDLARRRPSPSAGDAQPRLGLSSIPLARERQPGRCPQPASCRETWQRVRVVLLVGSNQEPYPFWRFGTARHRPLPRPLLQSTLANPQATPRPPRIHYREKECIFDLF